MICHECGKEFVRGHVCPRCGASIHTNFICPRCKTPVTGNICKKCGAKLQIPNADRALNAIPDYSSDKSKWVAFFLCLFLGTLGIHRFYVGKTGTGILMIAVSFFTLIFSAFWIWPLIDLILIVAGKFKDSNGYYLD